MKVFNKTRKFRIVRECAYLTFTFRGVEMRCLVGGVLRICSENVVHYLLYKSTSGWRLTTINSRFSWAKRSEKPETGNLQLIQFNENYNDR